MREEEVIEIFIEEKNLDKLDKAVKQIKKEGLVSASAPYYVPEDPIYSFRPTGRWNFKKPEAIEYDVSIHLVYRPSLTDKVKEALSEYL